MNWSLYGWFILVAGLARLLTSTSEPKPLSKDARVGNALFRLSLYMPLVGHLVGWW